MEVGGQRTLPPATGGPPGGKKNGQQMVGEREYGAEGAENIRQRSSGEVSTSASGGVCYTGLGGQVELAGVSATNNIVSEKKNPHSHTIIKNKFWYYLNNR